MIETLSFDVPRAPLSSIRIFGALQPEPVRVVTEIAEIPSAAESIGWPMKYRLPPAS